MLGITENFFFDLSLISKISQKVSKDLVSILQDESHGRMVSRNDYYEITGNDGVAPRGMNCGNGWKKTETRQVWSSRKIIERCILAASEF